MLHWMKSHMPTTSSAPAPSDTTFRYLERKHTTTLQMIVRVADSWLDFSQDGVLDRFRWDVQVHGKGMSAFVVSGTWTTQLGRWINPTSNSGGWTTQLYIGGRDYMRTVIRTPDGIHDTLVEIKLARIRSCAAG